MHNGQENIAVTGKGILDGQANENNWWAWKGNNKRDGKKVCLVKSDR